MSPFREVEHTADWALQVWAPALAALFVDAARGMCALAGAVPQAAGRVERRLEVSGADHESLLVAWLSELLYAIESEGLAFDGFQIESLEPDRLTARVFGAPAAVPAKAIKAVTYHNLSIRRTPEGFETTIVFDV